MTSHNSYEQHLLKSERLQLTVTPLSFHSRASKSASSTISRCWPYSVRALVDLVGLQAMHNSLTHSTKLPSSHFRVSDDAMLVAKWRAYTDVHRIPYA